MDFLTAYAIYATGAILLVGMFAVRVPREDVRIVFLLALMWPVSILAILGMVVLTAIDWTMDVDTNAGKVFHFRRPTNPKAVGFALCLLGVEFQFYKMKKVDQ
jgi:hypothetical protein